MVMVAGVVVMMLISEETGGGVGKGKGKGKGKGGKGKRRGAPKAGCFRCQGSHFVQDCPLPYATAE